LPLHQTAQFPHLMPWIILRPIFRKIIFLTCIAIVWSMTNVYRRLPNPVKHKLHLLHRSVHLTVRMKQLNNALTDSYEMRYWGNLIKLLETSEFWLNRT
jgi:hypothetical protein